MPGLMTWDEYETGLNTSPDSGFKEVKKGLTEGRSRKAPVLSKTVHVLMYPENVAGRYHNGTYIVGDEKLDIIDGLIKTDKEESKNMLIQKGFIFIRSEVQQ